MKLKRKISVRKVLQLLVTVIVVTGCITAMLSASSVQVSKKVVGIDIRIKNDQYHFIDKQQVQDMLFNNRNIDLKKINLAKLNANQMERIVASNPWVEKAQVYVDNKRMLHIFITQRVPVARLFEQDGNSYYLDHSLKAMPLSDKYIHYTTVVTNVPVLKDDSFSTSMKAQIVTLVKHIDKDSFWNAQISQVIVTDDHLFEMVPVLGDQRILFGDTSRMQEKFDNLFGFYKKILNKIGWDKYQVLDVRFAGQVVASPALQWKKPVDKSLTNLDWVKTIIGNEPKPSEPDTSNTIIANTIINATGTVPQAAKTVVTPPKTQLPVSAPPKPQVVVKQAVPKPVVKPQVVAKHELPKPKAKPQVIAKHEQPKAKTKLQVAATVKKDVKKSPVNNKEKKDNKGKNNTEPSPRYLYQGNH